MIHQVDAIYENGVLRPLQPLHLKEAARVQVLVSEDTSNSSSELIDQELLKYALARTSLLTVIPTLEEIRTKLSQIPGSMAELIIAERGEFRLTRYFCPNISGPCGDL